MHIKVWKLLVESNHVPPISAEDTVLQPLVLSRVMHNPICHLALFTGTTWSRVEWSVYLYTFLLYQI